MDSSPDRNVAGNMESRALARVRISLSRRVRVDGEANTAEIRLELFILVTLSHYHRKLDIGIIQQFHGGREHHLNSFDFLAHPFRYRIAITGGLLGAPGCGGHQPQSLKLSLLQF